MSRDFEIALAAMPVLAILRGVRPEEAVAVGEALYSAGIRVIEVPFNSPDALSSIGELARHLGESCVVGAGTVVQARDVERVVACGGRLVVSPNTDRRVIATTLEAGAVSLPGVATATEAFDAYASGARYLKLFPASTYGTRHLQALLAVMPTDARFIGVGGIGPDELAGWMTAGAYGVGIGSELYRPGDSPAAVSARASAVVEAVNRGKCA